MDQNLMTEWHVRYQGRGVVIYWHMERQATCICSQLKRCSSSEVSAMIEGVLRHYVDSHGQSEVAFAFCHLLGFDLAPRLKAIARQKLYLPDAELRGVLDNLAPILSRVIDWALIERQYDEVIKYAAALREPPSSTRPVPPLANSARSSRQSSCTATSARRRCAARSMPGLNVVENWNGAHSFIFFGKGGEVASNRLEDQELSVLALHLLQNCLVYVNALMLATDQPRVPANSAVALPIPRLGLLRVWSS